MRVVNSRHNSKKIFIFRPSHNGLLSVLVVGFLTWAEYDNYAVKSTVLVIIPPFNLFIHKTHLPSTIVSSIDRSSLSTPGPYWLLGSSFTRLKNCRLVRSWRIRFDSAWCRHVGVYDEKFLGLENRTTSLDGCNWSAELDEELAILYIGVFHDQNFGPAFSLSRLIGGYTVVNNENEW